MMGEEGPSFFSERSDYIPTRKTSTPSSAYIHRHYHYDMELCRTTLSLISIQALSQRAWSASAKTICPIDPIDLLRGWGKSSFDKATPSKVRGKRIIVVYYVGNDFLVKDFTLSPSRHIRILCVVTSVIAVSYT